MDPSTSSIRASVESSCDCRQKFSSSLHRRHSACADEQTESFHQVKESRACTFHLCLSSHAKYDRLPRQHFDDLAGLCAMSIWICRPGRGWFRFENCFSAESVSVFLRQPDRRTCKGVKNDDGGFFFKKFCGWKIWMNLLYLNFEFFYFSILVSLSSLNTYIQLISVNWCKLFRSCQNTHRLISRRSWCNEELIWRLSEIFTRKSKMFNDGTRRLYSLFFNFEFSCYFHAFFFVLDENLNM